MDVNQTVQLMKVNNLSNLASTGSSLSGTGLYDTSSMFETMLQNQISNMVTKTESGNSESTAASNTSSASGLSLQPEKINQMVQVMLLQSMLSSASSIGSDDSSSSFLGGSSSSSGMSQILQLMLLSALTNQTAGSSSNTQSGTNTDSINGSSNTNNNVKSNNQSDTPKYLGNIASKDIEDAIEKASQKYGVDKDLIKAVIKQESGFKANVVSSAGAIGLMQLMPGTAKSLGVNPYNPVENVEGGTKYLKNLISAFNGSKELALAAYNGGISRMNRLGVDTVEEISKMPKETRNYVANVIKIYENNKNI